MKPSFITVGKKAALVSIAIVNGIVLNACNDNREISGDALRAWHNGVADRSERLYGYVSDSGQWVVKPQYFSANEFSGDLAIVRSEKGLHYIDPSGDLVIDRIYTPSNISFSAKDWLAAGDFNEGLAVIVVEGKIAIVDLNGSIKTFIDWDTDDFMKESIGGGDLSPKFSEGLIVLPLRGKVGAIDSDGEWIIPPQYDSLSKFKNGFSVAMKQDPSGTAYFGVINRSNKVILSFKYDWINIADKDKFVVTLKNQQGIVGVNGEWIVPLGDFKINRFENGISILKSEDGQARIIDSNGVAISILPWSKIGSFSEGLCGVWSPHDAGYIDSTGKKIFSIPVSLALRYFKWVRTGRI